MTNKNNTDWKEINRYIERNTLTGQCRLKGTTEIIPNLRYDNTNGLRNYAVTKFEKRSLDSATNTTDIDDNLPILPYEEWRWCIGIPGVNDNGSWEYKVSNTGRYANVTTGEILPQHKIGGGNKKGEYYRGVSLGGVAIYSHKGVALAFCYNDDPANKTVAHHKDFNKLNNNAENLVWMSPAEHNRLHGKINGKHNNRAKQREAAIKPITITDAVTNTTLRYESITDAAKDIKAKRTDIRGSEATVIARLAKAASGVVKSAYGYSVRYVG